MISHSHFELFERLILGISRFEQSRKTLTFNLQLIITALVLIIFQGWDDNLEELNLRRRRLGTKYEGKRRKRTIPASRSSSFHDTA